MPTVSALFAVIITVTGPVGERLQAGTEDAPVLDHPAPLRRLHDYGAGYKYPDLLTYLLTSTAVTGTTASVHCVKALLVRYPVQG